MDEPSPPEIYIPHAQIGIGNMAMVVRGAIAPSAFSQSVEAVLRDLDPDLPLSSLKTLDEMRTASVSGRRFYVLLLTLFAAVALVLAAVGIFGVMSYAVTQQTREIGIRIALGADRDHVVRMILRRAGLLVLAGLSLGLAMAVGTGRALSSLLFELSPTDPVTLAACACCLPRSPSWPAISPRAGPRASIRLSRCDRSNAPVVSRVTQVTRSEYVGPSFSLGNDPP